VAKSLLTGAQILLNYVQHIFPGEGRTFSWGGLARPSKGPVPDTATGSLNITNFSSKRIFAKNIARPTKLECIVPDSVFFLLKASSHRNRTFQKYRNLKVTFVAGSQNVDKDVQPKLLKVHCPFVFFAGFAYSYNFRL